MTGGSVIIPMSNILTLLHIGTKAEIILSWGLISLAHFKNKSHIVMWIAFSSSFEVN